MLLTFPTGSNSIRPDEPLGAVIFMQDGTWAFNPHPEADDDDLHLIREFVDFIAFALKNQDCMVEFRREQKKTESQKVAEWRRENIRLVEKKEEN